MAVPGAERHAMARSISGVWQSRDGQVRPVASTHPKMSGFFPTG